MEISIIKTMNLIMKKFFSLLFFLVFSSVVYASDSKPNVLVLTANGEAFTKVVSGMTVELEEDINFNKLFIEKNTSTKEIDKAITTTTPKLIVLVGNSSIKSYMEYQKNNPKKSFPPSLAVSALFVDKLVTKLKNTIGIRYEIPAVTSIVNLRSVMSKPIKKVGVVYREWMTNLIVENQKYCTPEGIELVSYILPNKDSDMTDKLKNGIETLLKKGVDALWVVNDNTLLNGNTLSSAWLPTIGSKDIPVIVGIEPLLASNLNFGTFAVFPDHYALGSQAASVIGEIMDDDWNIEGREIEQPLSVKKMINIAVMTKKGIPFKSEKLSEMDHVITQ